MSRTFYSVKPSPSRLRAPPSPAEAGEGNKVVSRYAYHQSTDSKKETAAYGQVQKPCYAAGFQFDP